MIKLKIKWIFWQIFIRRIFYMSVLSNLSKTTYSNLGWELLLVIFEIGCQSFKKLIKNISNWLIWKWSGYSGRSWSVEYVTYQDCPDWSIKSISIYDENLMYSIFEIKCQPFKNYLKYIVFTYFTIFSWLLCFQIV